MWTTFKIGVVDTVRIASSKPLQPATDVKLKLDVANFGEIKSVKLKPSVLWMTKVEATRMAAKQLSDVITGMLSGGTFGMSMGGNVPAMLLADAVEEKVWEAGRNGMLETVQAIDLPFRPVLEDWSEKVLEDVLPTKSRSGR